MNGGLSIFENFDLNVYDADQTSAEAARRCKSAFAANVAGANENENNNINDAAQSLFATK